MDPEQVDERINVAIPTDNSIQAHQVDPFQQQPATQTQQTAQQATQQQRVPIFKRLGEANLAEQRKKQRTDQFLAALGQYE